MEKLTSLHRPTRSQEANAEEKASACFALNDGGVVWSLGAGWREWLAAGRETGNPKRLEAVG
jgi:hypothetical protein